VVDLCQAKPGLIPIVADMNGCWIRKGVWVNKKTQLLQTDVWPWQQRH